MKKNFLKLSIILSLLIIIPYSCITALGNIDWTPECEKTLQAHPDFVSIEQKWYDKLGTHYLINLTENRILEFDQIDSQNGGGKYACLSRIGEFKLRGDIKYVNDNGESDPWKDWKDCYSTSVRFCEISKAINIKLETMIDVIDNYNEIINFFKMIAKNQYLTGERYHIDSKNRRSAIRVWAIYDYYERLWHGAKEEDLGNWTYETMYGENWPEKLNADLPKIRKSLGLE